MSLRLYHFWPSRDHGLALEALVELARVRILRRAVDFATLAKLFGQPQAESPAAIDDQAQETSRAVGLAIRRAARVAPFHCNCLTQAICGVYMLRRRHISCTLYLGVATSSVTTRGDDTSKNSPKENSASANGSSVDRSREAHAWLRSGSLIIVGDDQLEKYQAVFPFGINPDHAIVISAAGKSSS